ncbi:MAG: hypothetical protein ACOC4I_04140, partial [Spirochaetota bacterium]
MLRRARFVLTALVVLAAIGACAGMPAGREVPSQDVFEDDETPDTETDSRESARPDGGEEDPEDTEEADTRDETDEAAAEAETPDAEAPEADTGGAVVPGDDMDESPSSGTEEAAMPALETLPYDDDRMTQAMRRERARRLAALRLDEMSLDEQIGQMLMPSYIFDERSRPVLSVTDRIRTDLADVRPGGIILFGQNIADPDQT